MTKMPNLNVELREIPNLSFAALKDLYITLYNQEPPRQLEKNFLYGALPTACKNYGLEVWMLKQNLFLKIWINQSFRKSLFHWVLRLLENLKVRLIDCVLLTVVLKWTARFINRSVRWHIKSRGEKFLAENFGEYNDGRNQMRNLYQKVNGRRFGKRV